MPPADQPNLSNGVDEDTESDEDTTLHTLFYTDWESSTSNSIGISFRTTRSGVIIPNSVGSAGLNPFAAANRQRRAANFAANAAARAERRRQLIATRGMPRYNPNRSWDHVVRLWNERARAGRPIELPPHERALLAAEITLPRHLDIEPPQNTWPVGWDVHHDYFLWSCRGTVPAVAERLQMVFRFDPPVQETFVADRLGGVNIYRQTTFLRTYLPGETHTMQRALARGVLYEADFSDPDVRGGFQDVDLDVEQHDPGDRSYLPPLYPRWGYHDWHRIDDAYAALYLGEHPTVLRREYGWAFPHSLSIEFLRVRMAQIPYLNISNAELVAAMERRNYFRDEYPQHYPRG